MPGVTEFVALNRMNLRACQLLFRKVPLLS